MSPLGRKAEKIFQEEKRLQTIDNQYNKQYQANENNKKAEKIPKIGKAEKGKLEKFPY